MKGGDKSKMEYQPEAGNKDGSGKTMSLNRKFYKSIDKNEEITERNICEHVGGGIIAFKTQTGKSKPRPGSMSGVTG